MIRTPVVMVNFKAYAEVAGPGDVELAKTCARVARDTGASIVVCPQTVDLAMVARSVDIPVFAQHVDPVMPGAFTGHVTAEAVLGAGAKGSLINHSEKRMPEPDIRKAVEGCRRAGIVSVVCTADVRMSRACAAFNPQFIAMEPPELIGGDISVTTADPKIVSDSASAVREVSPKTMVLTGAGVKTGADVRAALDLGTDGVLLASGVVRSKDPAKTLMDLVSKI